MKKVKMFIVSIIVLLLTGCTADYNIIMTSNKKIVENVKISKIITEIKNEGFDPEELKQTQENSYKSYLKLNNYKYNFNVKKEKLEGYFTKKSNSIKSIEKLSYFQEIYNNIEVQTENNCYSVKTSGIYNGLKLFSDVDGISEDPLLTELKINIQFHNKVIEANTDYYNKKTNTYTWVFNENTVNKNIEFKLSNKKRYDIIFKYIINNYKYIILAIFIGSVGIFIIIFKFSNNNKL